MARVSKVPGQIPEKVKVSIQGTTVSVEGPKGKLTKTVDPVVSIEQIEKTIVVKPAQDSRFARAMYGTVRSVLNGMITGVNTGFSKDLEIQGVGFKAAVQGKVINLSLGFSHPINYSIPEQVKVTVEDNTKITIEGPDKRLVGLVASEIRSFYPPEPYKGKGVRYSDEVVIMKETKKK